MTCEPILEDQLPHLLDLIGLGLRALRLQCHNLFDIVTLEDVVAPPDPFCKAESVKELRQLAEADVGVRGASEHLEERLLKVVTFSSYSRTTRKALLGPLWLAKTPAAARSVMLWRCCEDDVLAARTHLAVTQAVTQTSAPGGATRRSPAPVGAPLAACQA